ncbi:MAG: hypothetical protein IPK59_23405 [Rhodospirillaceae bacterium]|nr:hypothetical protein [Rhodospirillaceae bacterium]
MNQIVNERPQSARQQVERQQRRRREDLGPGRRRNLSVSFEKDPNYTYRWVNDEPGRVHALTVTDDWEVVTGDGNREAKDKALGSGVERIVDRRGRKAVLLRKLKHYYVEDKAKEQAEIDETEKSIKRGEARSPEGLSGPAAYVPAGGISISNGGRS